MRLIDFKSYVEPVSTGAILGAAGLSAGGQVASGLFKPSLKRQWKYQQKQMKLQQQYALEQMQKQGEINYANWQKQFDYENAYNDPSKVFDRYLKAGVTPAAVLGASGVGVNATMSGGSSGSVGASGPSGGSFDFSSPLPPGVGSAAAGTALDAMGVNSTIERNKAAANRDDAEAENIRSNTFEPEFNKARAEAAKAVDEALANKEIETAAALKSERLLNDLNNTLLSLTLDARVEEANALADTAKEELRQLRIQGTYVDRMVKARVLVIETQSALNEALSGLASANAEGQRINNLDLANELSRNWDKRFDVEVPNPQYEKNLRSSNPIIRANAGPRSFKLSMSLKDFYDKTEINRSKASEFLPEEARIALRNAKLDPYLEIGRALVGVAGSVAGAGIVRGAMSRAAGTISAGGSSSSSAGSSLTTRYDSKGNVVGYAKTEMNRSGHSSTYGTTRKSR